MSKRLVSAVVACALVGCSAGGEASPSAATSSVAAGSASASATSSASATPMVTATPGAYSVKQGEELRLLIGEANESIGHGFVMTAKPDTSVAVASLRWHLRNPTCAPGGCGQDVWLLIRGVNPGTTSVTVAYTYRGATPSMAPDGPGSRVWTITVTE